MEIIVVGFILLFVFLIFWAAYFLWIGLLTRWLPENPFRRFSCEANVVPENIKTVYKRLEKEDFFLPAEKGETVFEPTGLRGKWHRWTGRELVVRVQPTREDYKVCLEVKTRRNRFPVAPLTPRARRKYKDLLAVITLDKNKEEPIDIFHTHIGYKIGALGKFLEKFFISYLFFLTFGFIYVEIFKNNSDFLMESFLIHLFFSVALISSFSLFPLTFRSICRWATRHRKIIFPAAIFCLAIFSFWISLAENKLYGLRRETLASPWIVEAASKVPSDQLVSFCQRWVDQFPENSTGIPVGSGGLIKAQIDVHRMDNFENFAKEFQRVASGNLFESPEEDPSPHLLKQIEDFRPQITILMTQISRLVLARSFSEIRSGEPELGFARLGSVYNFQRKIVNFPDTFYQSDSFLIELAANILVSRVYIGMENLDIPQFEPRDSFSAKDFRRWFVAKQLLEVSHCRPKRFIMAIHVFFPKGLAFLFHYPFQLIMEKAGRINDCEAAYPPLLSRPMDAFGAAGQKRILRQAHRLYHEIKTRDATQVTQNMVEENKNFYPLMAPFFQGYAHLFTLELYRQLLDNRNILLVSRALWKYRQKYGGFPQTIETLVPQFLPEVPTSVLDGSPIQYGPANEFMYLGWPNEEGKQSFRWLKLNYELPSESDPPEKLPDLPRDKNSPFGPSFWLQ